MKKKLVVLVCTMLMTTTMIFTHNEKVNASDGERDWWDHDWSYCKKITIDRGFVTGDLQNFPVLIHNTSYDFYNHAQYDGDDFVFVSADNMTKYNHEIEKYDGASGELIAWINVTSLSDSEDTIIWMYYGNPNCDPQQNIPGTWDSNFVGVYHMDDSFGTLTDSAR